MEISPCVVKKANGKFDPAIKLNGMAVIIPNQECASQQYAQRVANSRYAAIERLVAQALK